MNGSGPDLWGSVFESFSEGVESVGKKAGAGLLAIAVASSPATRALVRATGRQAAITVGKTIQDPVRSWQRAGTIIKTYNRIGKAAAVGKGAYDHFYRPKKYASSSSSTSSYQQYGGGGDTPTPAEVALGLGYLGHQVYKFATEKSYPKHPASPCRPGFVEKRVRGKLMCVRVKRTRK